MRRAILAVAVESDALAHQLYTLEMYAIELFSLNIEYPMCHPYS